MTNSANVNLVTSDSVGIFAEVVTAWSPRNLGIQTLSTDSIPKLFHCTVEPANGLGLIQNNENVDDWFSEEPRNRRTSNVMDCHTRLAKHA